MRAQCCLCADKSVECVGLVVREDAESEDEAEVEEEEAEAECLSWRLS